MKRIVLGDNLAVLAGIPDGAVDLIYVDPPFNTGRRRVLTRLRTTRDAGGDRTGFGGRRYKSETLGSLAFDDRFGDYGAFLLPRLVEGRRVLAPHGSFFLHLDPREAPYARVLADRVFGRASFMNEIVWAYDYGGRPKRRWPAKHDVILWYAKDPRRYVWNADALPRIPYAAPGLVGPEKAARGKTPTDVWWHTIVPTSGRERTGYPAQKPLGVVSRIVLVHSRPGDLLLDFFAGSGTLGEAAVRADRRFLLVDSNPEAIEVMRKRLAFCAPDVVVHRPDGNPVLA